MANTSAPIGVTAEDVRQIAAPLPRSEEAVVRDYLKFRVRGLVYLSVSPDETLMGFAYPKEERADLVASDPDKFLMPVDSDLRFNWVRARMAALDVDELTELVLDAWRMVVPKKVAIEHLGS
jgi:hypothetical protein